MAGKGGGSWKVAYADFVTAMMAFFLVMWLSAQDQSVKTAVASYFSRPEQFGLTKRPGRIAGIFKGEIRGDRPMGESVTLGRGRSAHTRGEVASPNTKLLSEWIHSQQDTYEHWKEQARSQLEAAALSADKPDDADSIRTVATKRLAAQMRNDFTLGMPPRLGDLYQDLLVESLTEVNWKEVAEDILDGI
jgi:flagellar motor protein MotB